MCWIDLSWPQGTSVKATTFFHVRTNSVSVCVFFSATPVEKVRSGVGSWDGLIEGYGVITFMANGNQRCLSLDRGQTLDIGSVLYVVSTRFGNIRKSLHILSFSHLKPHFHERILLEMSLISWSCAWSSKGFIHTTERNYGNICSGLITILEPLLSTDCWLCSARSHPQMLRFIHNPEIFTLRSVIVE